MDILCANLICAFKRNSSDGIGLRMHCFSFQIGKILNAATHTSVNCFSLTSLSIPNWPNSFHISNYSCWMFKGIVASIRKHISFSLSALVPITNIFKQLTSYSFLLSNARIAAICTICQSHGPPLWALDVEWFWPGEVSGFWAFEFCFGTLRSLPCSGIGNFGVLPPMISERVWTTNHSNVEGCHITVFGFHSNIADWFKQNAPKKNMFFQIKLRLNIAKCSLNFRVSNVKTF